VSSTCPLRRFAARHPCRFITRLPASECLSLAWPLRRRSGANSAAGPQGEGQEPVVRESHQREGHPKAAVSGLLSSDSATALRGFADSTSVCWQRTGRGPSRPPCGPFLRPAATANGTLEARILRAKAKNKAEAKAEAEAEARDNLLCLACAGRAVDGAPMQWQRHGGKARRVGARDCAQFAASPGMDWRRTSGVALRSRRAGRLHGCRR
jgi:hypothetical protein